jgi:hypothetical protein
MPNFVSLWVTLALTLTPMGGKWLRKLHFEVNHCDFAVLAIATHA